MLLSSQNLYISGSKDNLEKNDDKSDNLVESAIQEVNGFGLFQVRSLVLLGLPPLSIFQLWVMQVFWGQIPKHDCVNGTSVLIPCQNSTECEIVMNSTYTADFDLLCDRKDLYPQVQSALLIGSVIGEMFFGNLQDRIGRRKTILISCYAYTLLVIGFIFASNSGNYTLFLVTTFCIGTSLGGMVCPST